MPHVPRSIPSPRAARPLLVAALLLGLAVGLTALSRAASATEASPPPALRGDAAAGGALYGTACAVCHGETGRGLVAEDGELIGSPLTGVGTASVDFMIRTGRMPLAAVGEPLERQPQQLSDQQRLDLIAFLEPIVAGGPEIPELAPVAAELNAGRELFTTNCAACHGPTARGIAVGQRDIAPNLEAATPIEIAEAVRTGPGRMPVFSDEVLDAEELNDVVAWVLDLRDRAQPGGLALGRSGPVWEGLVAWAVGLGLLLIVMYLLGEKEPEPEPDGPAADDATGDGDVEAG